MQTSARPINLVDRFERRLRLQQQHHHHVKIEHSSNSSSGGRPSLRHPQPQPHHFNPYPALSTRRQPINHNNHNKLDALLSHLDIDRDELLVTASQMMSVTPWMWPTTSHTGAAPSSSSSSPSSSSETQTMGDIGDELSQKTLNLFNGATACIQEPEGALQLNPKVTLITVRDHSRPFIMTPPPENQGEGEHHQHQHQHQQPYPMKHVEVRIPCINMITHKEDKMNVSWEKRPNATEVFDALGHDWQPSAFQRKLSNSFTRIPATSIETLRHRMDESLREWNPELMNDPEIEQELLRLAEIELTSAQVRDQQNAKRSSASLTKRVLLHLAFLEEGGAVSQKAREVGIPAKALTNKIIIAVSFFSSVVERLVEVHKENESLKAELRRLKGEEMEEEERQDKTAKAEPMAT